MRTKTLVLSALLGATGMVSSLAQVYSVNAVGYINLDVGPGWQLVANQLDNKNGNKVVDVLAGLPDQATLYKYTGTGYKLLTYYVDVGGNVWDGSDLTVTLNPGEGAWLFVPAAAPASTKVTLVGEVPQGTLVSSIPKGFSIMSSTVPKDLDFTTEAQWPAEDLDTIYKWNRTKNGGAGGYDIATCYADGANFVWDGATPTAKVGESFWINKMSAKTWTRTFSVNP